MSAPASYIIENDKDFLKFLKSRYPLFHLSNVFFRDLHYGVMAYLEQNKKRSGYTSAEDITRDVIAHFQEQGIFRTIDDNTWLLLYPSFKAVAPKKPAPAKPAGAAAGARPAAGGAKPAPAKPAPSASAQPAATKEAPPATAGKTDDARADGASGKPEQTSEGQPA